MWIAVVRPTVDDFGIESNQIVWRAETISQSGTGGDHAQWTDYAFGEPHVALLPDGTFLLTLWSAQRTGNGILYARLRASE